MSEPDSIPSYVLEKNTRLQHIYNKDYGPISFNDSGFGHRRFDPIEIDGKIISSHYSTLWVGDAIVETILRENESTGEREFSGNPSIHAFVEIDVKRDLVLADVSALSIMDKYMKAGESAYTHTQTLSASIAINTEFDGLSWYSKQGGEGHRCFMFFGHRVKLSDMELKRKYDLLSVSGKQHLKDAAVACGCELPEHLINN